MRNYTGLRMKFNRKFQSCNSEGGMAMQAILYVGHGTRSTKGAEEAKLFLNEVMNRVEAEIQEISFLELTQPTIEESFERCIEVGATNITVVPLFLLAAGHIKQDIPEKLKYLQQKHPFVQVIVADPFGVQEIILDGIVELIKETAGELMLEDSLLIVGRGSSDTAIHQNFLQIVTGIASRLTVSKVNVCYLAATTPTFSEGIEHMSRTTVGRVVVIPYLLFGGLLLSEIQAEVRKRKKRGESIILTSALSKHQAIQDIVVEKGLQYLLSS